MLAEIGKLGAKPCSTLVIPNVCLTKDNEDPCDDSKRYRRLEVGWKAELPYSDTRLDIAFAISVVSQFMSVSIVKHWAILE